VSKTCSHKGITTIELLITMGIMFAVTSAGALSYRFLMSSFHQSASRNQYEADISRAKSEALREGTRVVIEFLPSGNGYQVGFDYLPFDAPPAIETLVFQRQFPRRITVSPTTQMVFDSRGFSIDEDGVPPPVAQTLADDGVNFASVSISVSGIVTISD
jgi:Tfp pilus assembly protein FimT